MSVRYKISWLSFVCAACITLAAALNYGSFNFAKNACVDNNKTPIVDKSFLAINWSVSCK
jgi:hypothetical protein